MLYDNIYAGSFYASSFFRTSNNGFGALIYLEDSDSSGTKATYQFWVLDSVGKKIWTRILPETYSTTLDASIRCHQSAIQTRDGNFIVVTSEPLKNNSNSIIFRKYDRNGTLLNNTTITIDMVHTVNSVVELPSGDILIGGTSNTNVTVNSDFLILRTSSTGTLLWGETFGDSNIGDGITNLNVVDDHTFIISGYTNTGIDQYATTSKAVVIKANDLISSVNVQPAASDGIELYPNPTSTSFTLSGLEGVASVRLVNSIGMEVKQLSILNSQFSIDVSGLANGLYFVNIRTATGATVKPILVSH